MPTDVVTQAPDWSATEARALATQYATGLANGFTPGVQIPQDTIIHRAAPEGDALMLAIGQSLEANADEIEDTIKGSASLMKHPLGVAKGMALIAGTIGGIVLREAGRQWDNDSVERIGKIISDVSGFSSTLLRPDGRLDNGIVGAIVVTADLYSLARPGSKRAVDNAANALQWLDLAAHQETIGRAIAVGVPQLSLDPLVIPDP